MQRNAARTRKYCPQKNRCGIEGKRNVSMKISPHCVDSWLGVWGDLGTPFGRNYGNSYRPRAPYKNTYSITSCSMWRKTLCSGTAFRTIPKLEVHIGTPISRCPRILGAGFTFVPPRAFCSSLESITSEKLRLKKRKHRVDDALFRIRKLAAEIALERLTQRRQRLDRLQIRPVHDHRAGHVRPHPREDAFRAQQPCR